MIVAERFMTLLEYAHIPHAASTVADQALYAAKTLGRNQIYQAAPLVQPVTPTRPYR